MTISSLPTLDISDVGAGWPDEVLDLTDRRRLLVLAVLRVDVAPGVADALFDDSTRGAGGDGQASSSTTIRSAGRSSSTDDT